MRGGKFIAFMCLFLAFFLFLTSCSPQVPPYEPEPFIREDAAFTSLPFYLPETDEIKTLIQKFVDDMKAAKSAGEQIELMIDYDSEIRRVGDMYAISYIRFTQSTSDEAKADYEHFTQLISGISDDDHEANLAIVESKYIKSLEAYFGKDIIDQYRDSVKRYNPDYTNLQ